jgi:hypothetical protein
MDCVGTQDASGHSDGGQTCDQMFSANGIQTARKYPSIEARQHRCEARVCEHEEEVSSVERDEQRGRMLSPLLTAIKDGLVPRGEKRC